MKTGTRTRDMRGMRQPPEVVDPSVESVMALLAEAGVDSRVVDRCGWSGCDTCGDAFDRAA